MRGALLICTLLSIAHAAPRPGVAVGLFSSTTDDEWAQTLYRQMIDEVAALGATDIQLTIRWVQDDVTSTAIGPQLGITPSDAVVRDCLQYAKRKGLKIFLLPIIHLEKRSSTAWRGTLKPADRAAWWASYRGFILRYARLGAKDALLLAVGSELVSMEADEAEWRRLIRDVRAVFPGLLTYSANWDHYLPVKFWDAVDFVGISAYWPIAKTPDDDVATMTARWQAIRNEIGRFALRAKKPIILTEVGYRSDAEGATKPWLHTRRVPPNMEVQRRAWAATRATWEKTPWLTSVYAWNWFGQGGPRDTSHTPRDKPAQAVLEAWIQAAGGPKKANSTAQ